MYYRVLLFIVTIAVFWNCSQEIEIIKGHAHNDYENENPLYDALENGFISVEADVHLIDDQLYVSHDRPEKLDSVFTLKTLFLSQ